MTLDVEALTNSSVGIDLLSAVAGKMPPRLGHRLADFVARQIALRRSSRLVRAVRGNQWVVLGGRASSEMLDRAVRETLRNSARAVFDLYHYIDDPEAVRKQVIFEPAALELAQRPEFAQRGIVVAGVHLSNFDLIMRWLCQLGARPLALTLHDPRGGRRRELEMRRQTGITLVPTNVAGLRQAIRHLQRGGAVLTSIDYPAPGLRLLPRFFGRQAALPVHHVFLARTARVPIAVVSATREDDGKYHARASELIELDGHQQGDQVMLRDAEELLKIAEDYIRRAPQQWSVAHPVWPSSMHLVPE